MLPRGARHVSGPQGAGGRSEHRQHLAKQERVGAGWATDLRPGSRPHQGRMYGRRRTDRCGLVPLETKVQTSSEKRQ